MSQILPPKKDVALALLERASVFVHLDPRGAGVVVPMHFKKQPRLVLQIGLNMAVPIPDLRLDDQGLSCTLSFNRSLFHCVVPWSGIFALVGEDGRGMVWPDDVPQEIAREMSPAKDDSKTDGGGATAPGAPAPAGRERGLSSVGGGRKRPHVSLVASGGVRAGADPKRPSKRAGATSKPSAGAGAGDRGGARRKRDDAEKPILFKVDSDGKPSKPSKPTQIGRGATEREHPRGKFERSDEKPRANASPRGDAGAKPAGPTAFVPSAPASPSAPSMPGKPASPSPGTGAAGAPLSSSPATPSSSPPGKRSPKRELPPYLRVVK